MGSLRTDGAIPSLFAGAPIGLGVLDADLRWCEVNAALAALQSLPAEAVLGLDLLTHGTGIHDVVHALDISAARQR